MRRFILPLLSIIVLMVMMNGCVAVKKYELKDGYDRLNSEDVESARKTFENIISETGDPLILSQAYEGLGWVYIVMDDLHRAESYFNESLSQNSSNTDAMYGMMICGWISKDWRKLEEWGETFRGKAGKSYSFTKVQKYSTNWDEVMKLLLVCYAILGENEKVVDLLEELPADDFTNSIRRAVNGEL